ncbi:MAG TPA: hypothetical protein VEW28_09960 [Candidatus Kapabacteria bacterium]|nr:hypothetical protein [Candidatus Kapabacteria bacterium]
MIHLLKIVFLLGLISTPSLAQSGYDTCAHMKAWADIKPFSKLEAQQQYDTLRLYIEKCTATDPTSWEVFTNIRGAVGLLDTGGDIELYERYRAWLISVLYLNTTTPQYFCECVGSIAGTYIYGKYNPLGYLAVLNYLRNNHHECWGPVDSAGYVDDSTTDAQHGSDPSHLPSLDSLGLGFLLNHNAVTPSSPLPSQYLASFTTNPNPFKNETTLSFTFLYPS